MTVVETTKRGNTCLCVLAYFVGRYVKGDEGSTFLATCQFQPFAEVMAE